MPEGPEIKLAADRLASVLVGRPLEEVWFAFADLEEEFAVRLARQHVDAVQARGKGLLIHFPDDLTIYSHNNLYGRWYVVPSGKGPATNRQLRLALKTEKHWALLYSASDIAVLDEEARQEHPYLSKLGPDLLDTTPKAVKAQLESKRCRNKSLAVLYLDQSFLAGSGNYLRSEILHEAALAPLRKPSSLSAEEMRRLSKATLLIPQRSYETKGITNEPKRVAQLKKQGLKRRAYRHLVFGRDGKPCYRCGKKVQKDALAGRRLYWCPNCQL